MRFNPSQIFIAVLAMSLPAVTLAQTASVVVPPPAPLVANPAPASGTASKAAPAVMPAASVTSANPAAVAGGAPVVTPPAPLVDIAIPQAPKPEANSDLKPKAPAQPQKAAKRTVKPSADEGSVAKKKAAPDPFAGIAGTPVSDSQLNRFVFPEPIEGVYFQEGAPLPECPQEASEQDPCKPVFLNGKRMMLLQLRAGAKGPVQMLTHLHSGRIVTMNLMPVAGPGAVVRVDGAEDGASDNRLAAAAKSAGQPSAGLSSTEQDVALLSRFAKGDIPAGFEPEAVGGPIRFEYFDVIPLATWSNGSNMRAHLMQVKAFGSAPVAINAGLFRSENIRALALDKDTITESSPAQLYLLEYVPTEMQ